MQMVPGHFTGKFRLPPAAELHATGNTNLVVHRQVSTGIVASPAGEICHVHKTRTSDFIVFCRCAFSSLNVLLNHVDILRKIRTPTA